MQQPTRLNGSLHQGHQGTRQFTDVVSCVPDTHHGIQGTLSDQQPKGATSGSKYQLTMPWEETQQAPHLCQADDSHWAPGPVGMPGTRGYCQAPSWESKVAAVWGKPSPPQFQPAATAAPAASDAVADVLGPEHVDVSHWVGGHRLPAQHDAAGSMHGTVFRDSHWACSAPTQTAVINGVVGPQRQPLGQQAATPGQSAEAKMVDHETASPSGEGSAPRGGVFLDGRRCTQQHGAFMQTAIAAQQQHPGTAGMTAAAADDSMRSPVGQSAGPGSPEAAMPNCSVGAQQHVTALAADGNSLMHMEAEPGLAAAGSALAAGSMKRQLPAAHPLNQQPDADACLWDDEPAVDGSDRHQDADELLGAEMPTLKKLRTRVQGLRVDSADDRTRASSPAAADNMGGFIPTPTYGSPRVEQTMRSYPDLDCGSAKASGAGTAATKPSGLSRFAPAAGCPISPAVAVTGDGYGGRQLLHQQQLTRGEDGRMVGLEGARLSRAASQTGEAPGPADTPGDDQWVKHHRELQQLKQQQDALRALLQQAEQQVRGPLLQEAEHLDAEMQEKVGKPAADEAMADMQQDLAKSTRAAESDAERVAAQMLAQEGGDWEKAMQRMLNLVQSTMQHGSQGSGCSNPRVSQLKRSSSTASTIHRAASLAASAAVDDATADAELGQVVAGAGAANSPQVLKRDLSRQGSSHWGLQRQEGVQGSMSPYAAGAAATAPHTSPYQAGSGAAGHNSPYTAAANTGSPYAAAAHHISPYAPANAAAATEPHSSPFAGGPVSAAKLAWPMVPASAVGSPVGSPACSPMVPTSAVGSPMAAPADATATVGGISNMILPTTGWGCAAGCGPAATGGARYGSPVANQHGMLGEGCSPRGSPGPAAGTRGKSRSPVCTTGRPKAGLVRQPSRMAPKPPRASVASITGGFGAGLSVSAGGPAAYTHDAVTAGLSVSAGGPAAFTADVAAAAVAGLSVSSGGPCSYHMGSAAVPQPAEAMEFAVEAAPAVQACDDRYAAGGYPCAPGNIGCNSQRVEMPDCSAADAIAAFAAHADQAAVQEVNGQQHPPQQQQQQPAMATTAAAAAAAFGKVPSVSVDQELEDAAGWLFGENGLLPDTPGPVNLMTQQNQPVGHAPQQPQNQQQQQDEQQQQMMAAARMGQLVTLQPQHQMAVPCQGQSMINTSMPTQAPTQQCTGAWPPAVQGNSAGTEYRHGMYSHMQTPAHVHQSATAHGAAESAVEAVPMSVPAAGGGWGNDAATWQYMHQLPHQMHAATGDASAEAAHEQYQQVQQQQSQQSPQERPAAAAAVPAGAVAVGDDGEATQALGSDKDDLALLQVLLGWASDDA